MAVLDLPFRLRTSDAARVRPAVSSAGSIRLYFVLLALLGLVAFVLNVENRLTSAGLFFFTPQLDLLPPLSAARWYEAYTLHQQDPVFTACGGSESLDEFKLLYLWNWFARASAVLLAAASAVGFVGAAAMRAFRPALPRLAALALLGGFYLIASFATGFALAHSADLARYDVGQYRHAADVLFATAALAVLLVAAGAPARAERSGTDRTSRYAWIFIGAILLDIAFGAMFASRNAAAVWTTWPGYEGALLPPLDRLTSFSPLWLNLSVNQYALQLVHRVLSIGLWAAALLWLVTASRRDPARVKNALALLLLLSAQMGAGIATLVYGTPAWLSIAHQVGSAFLLAGAFVVLYAPRPESTVDSAFAQAPSVR